jgi:hypothetical protein
VVQAFGHPPHPDFSTQQLAAHVLEMPDTHHGWYLASAVTLAAAMIAAQTKDTGHD